MFRRDHHSSERVLSHGGSHSRSSASCHITDDQRNLSYCANNVACNCELQRTLNYERVLERCGTPRSELLTSTHSSRPTIYSARLWRLQSGGCYTAAEHSAHLAIVEDRPSSILPDMRYVVSASCVLADVRDEPHHGVPGDQTHRTCLHKHGHDFAAHCEPCSEKANQIPSAICGHICCRGASGSSSLTKPEQISQPSAQGAQAGLGGGASKTVGHYATREERATREGLCIHYIQLTSRIIHKYGHNLSITRQPNALYHGAGRGKLHFHVGTQKDMYGMM